MVLFPMCRLWENAQSMRTCGNCGQARPVWVGHSLSDALDVVLAEVQRLGKVKVKVVGQECPTHTGKSNIQVFHVQRVLFDKLTARFYVFAHEGGEDGFALG